MIRIQVSAYGGAPPHNPLFALFDESGGKIGRGQGCALVLDDPSRTISRTHATVSFRDGVFYLRNLGSALPVYLNGDPLKSAEEAPIAPGDDICIDGYEM